jgi:membrane protein implicated in regulation of membrane protease activity
METNGDNRSDFDGDGFTVVGMLVGLGIVTLTLFPFMVPALAVLAIFVLPLLAAPIALAVPIALLAVPVLAVRALVRRRRRSGHSTRATSVRESVPGLS